MCAHSESSNTFYAESTYNSDTMIKIVQDHGYTLHFYQRVPHCIISLFKFRKLITSFLSTMTLRRGRSWLKSNYPFAKLEYYSYNEWAIYACIANFTQVSDANEFIQALQATSHSELSVLCSCALEPMFLWGRSYVLVSSKLCS